MPNMTATTLPPAFRDLGLSQLGIMVPDLEEGIRSYGSVLPLDEWLVYTYSPENVHDLSYRGAPAQLRFRLALAGSNPQIELIQPIDGPSIYHEWIERHGFGLQHLGFHVPKLAPVVAKLADQGWEPVQAGSGYGLDGDGAFAYYDTVAELGLMLEVIEVPARRMPSEALNSTARA